VFVKTPKFKNGTYVRILGDKCPARHRVLCVASFRYGYVCDYWIECPVGARCYREDQLEFYENGVDMMIDVL
jgi:hypothetical protein